MRFSWGASWWHNPPCQFFCFISCERATYSMPSLSVRNWIEFLESCWWNSKPLDTKWMDRSYHTRYLNITGLDSDICYSVIFWKSFWVIIGLCWVGFDKPSCIFCFNFSCKIPLACLNVLSWTISTIQMTVKCRSYSFNCVFVILLPLFLALYK